MKPETINLQRADDPRDVVHRAVQELAEGRLVAFPTETVYGVAASALDESAVQRLMSVKRRPETKPLTLVVKSAEEALDYVPEMSRLGRRLARRCWPGPVTLVFNNSVERGLVRELPAAVAKLVAPDGSVGLRVPAHSTVLEVMKMLPGPIVLTSANRSGEPPAVTAEGVVNAVGEGVSMVLDGGRCRYGQPSTVVRVSGSQWELVREGVVPLQTIQRLSNCIVLFVCTGNTCRSPLAEGLCKKMLSDRMGCTVNELSDQGFTVNSAGIAAVIGSGPSPEAIEVARHFGVRLEEHLSQPLTRPLVYQSDYIFSMTDSHREAILARYPEAAGKTQLLCRRGGDISDPLGSDVATYRQCAAQIESNLKHIVPELQA